MLDFDGLQEVYEKTVEIGLETMTAEERIELCARACNENLRRLWCQVFKLEPAAVQLVLQKPYPPESQWIRNLHSSPPKPAPVDYVSPYRNIGFEDAELQGIISRLLLDWCVTVPQSLGVKPLPVWNDGRAPRDWEELGRKLKPWASQGSPNQPANLHQADRMSAAHRFWRNVVERVYQNPRLNGSVPGLRGCSLEWLSECVVAPNGRPLPTLRLERLLCGYYKLSPTDQAVMERVG